MTTKQKKKFAQELAECEKIHEDINASAELKKQAEDRILYLTNKIFSEPNGFELMTDIDDLVQEYLK